MDGVRITLKAVASAAGTAARNAAAAADEKAAVALTAANQSGAPETAGVALGQRIAGAIDEAAVKATGHTGIKGEAATAVGRASTSGLSAILAVAGASIERIAPRLHLPETGRQAVEAAGGLSKGVGAGHTANTVMDGAEAAARAITP